MKTKMSLAFFVSILQPVLGIIIARLQQTVHRQQTQQAAKCKHVGVLVLVTALRKRLISTSGVRDTSQLWEEEAEISSGVKVGDGESGKMHKYGTEGGARGL